MRATALLLALATPAAAQDLTPAQLTALLTQDTPEAGLAGAIGTCFTGTTDPDAAIAVFTDGGWQRSDEYEGTAGFVGPTGYAMLWTDPGFCMVETSLLGTEALAGVLVATAEGAGMTVTPLGPDEQGCAMFDLGIGVMAVLSSGGQDPVCDSTTDAALRFNIADQ